MNIDPTLRKSIIASIIASVLVIIFVKPIMNLIWGFMSWIGVNVYEGYIDTIYSNAALGQRDWVSVTIFSFIVALLLGVITGAVTMVVLRERILKIKKKQHKNAIISKSLHIIFGLAFLIALLLLLTSVYTDLQLNTSFQQRLTVLAPKISDQQYKSLNASWALMQSRTDYFDIVSEMERLADMHKIELPKLLLD